MSDRYDTPRWDDEPRDLGDDEPSRLDDPDALDLSSENVLDEWPGGTRVEDDDDPSAAGDQREAGAAPGTAEGRVEQLADPRQDTSPAIAVGDEDVDELLAHELDEVDELDRVDELDEVGQATEGELHAPLADHLSESSEHAPGELTVPPGFAVLEGEARGARRTVGVVVARFNGDVTTRLLESALDELEARGVDRDSITVMPVPGAFELPLAAMALAKTRRFASVVALGCVIRGDTPHFDYVCNEAASGLQLAGIETGVPVSFGVLTLDRIEQAEARIGKGAEAVRTALEMADLFANLRAAAAKG